MKDYHNVHNSGGDDLMWPAKEGVEKSLVRAMLANILLGSFLVDPTTELSLLVC